MAAAPSSTARHMPSRIAGQLARARSLNPRLNAFTHLNSLEDVTAQLDHAPQAGSLGGLSLAVKDMFATSDGAPTSCGSRMLRDYQSPFEATVVRRLRAEGALVIGKANMDEFGMGSANVHSHFGPVLNPAGPVGIDESLALSAEEQRVAGGSSGGSAAAVAAGLCDVALATDTGGSTRLPASYCGILGFKPSYGLLSRYGVIAYASSLDTVGIMASEVEPLRRTFDAASAYDSKDPTSAPNFARTRADEVHLALREQLGERQGARAGEQPLQGVRIGVPADIFPHSLLSSSALLDPIRTFLRTLASLGATLSSVRLPSAPLGLSAYYVLASAEASSNLARYDGVQFGYRAEEKVGEKEQLYARTRTEGFGKEVRKRLLLGTFALSAEAFDNYYLQAQRVRRLIQLELDDLFSSPSPLAAPVSPTARRSDGVDFLLHPSTMSTAPLLSSYSPPSSGSTPTPTASPDDRTSASRSAYVQDLLSLPASLAGLPALSIPAGRATDDGWPVGVTLVGQWGADREVLEVAQRVEMARREAQR